MVNEQVRHHFEFIAAQTNAVGCNWYFWARQFSWQYAPYDVDDDDDDNDDD